MSNDSDSTYGETASVGERERPQAPAVGLVATAGTVDQVARALLRCRAAGYPVVLTCAGTPDSNLYRLGQRSDGVVVHSAGPESDVADDPEALATVARANGYPGLLYHSDPDRWIDFPETAAAHDRSEAFATETVTLENGATTLTRTYRTPDRAVAVRSGGRCR